MSKTVKRLLSDTFVKDVGVKRNIDRDLISDLGGVLSRDGLLRSFSEVAIIVIIVSQIGNDWRRETYISKERLVKSMQRTKKKVCMCQI